MTNRIVTKALAAFEDLLFGTGTVVQARSSGNVVVTKIDASVVPYENSESLRTKLGKKVEELENVAAMQALTTTTAEETFVFLLGYTTAGDGGGGLFWLDTTDIVSTEDLNLIFNPDVLANGRWKRADTSDQLSVDRGDANYTILAYDAGIQVYGTALTANRTVTLPTTGLYKGKKVSVLRTAGGSFNLLVGAITTLTGTGLVELRYNGTTWVILSEPSASAEAASDSFNGSFEIDADNNGQPDNWTVTPLASATIAIDSTDSAHGKNSLKFLSGGNGGGAVVSERFDVLKGETREIEFTYKASAVNVLFKVDVKTYNSAGAPVSTLPAYSEAAANPLVYTTKVVSVVIDATAVTAEIVITGIDVVSTTKAAGTTCHIDNVKNNPGSYTLALQTELNDLDRSVNISKDFTPILYGETVAGSPTYTTQRGTYLRVGNLVFISIELAITAKGTLAGGLRISGLPFAADIATKMFIPICHITNATGIAAGSIPGAQISVAGTELDLNKYSVTGGFTGLADTDFAATFAIGTSFCYSVAP